MRERQSCCIGDMLLAERKFVIVVIRDGQRGIVIVRTFNEAPDVPGPTVQHTISPGDRGAVGIAFLWRQFDLAALPGTLRARVMVTVPANPLICRRQRLGKRKAKRAGDFRHRLPRKCLRFNQRTSGSSLRAIPNRINYRFQILAL
jgi:hypothetical protein